MNYLPSRREFLGGLMIVAARRAFAEPDTPLTPSTNKFLLYAGTYTGHGSKGIYGFHFTAADGHLQPLGLVAETINPSALALVPFIGQHGSVRRLLAVRETSKDADWLD
jgi:hypothetical protein